MIVPSSRWRMGFACFLLDIIFICFRNKKNHESFESKRRKKIKTYSDSKLFFSFFGFLIRSFLFNEHHLFSNPIFIQCSQDKRQAEVFSSYTLKNWVKTQWQNFWAKKAKTELLICWVPPVNCSAVQAETWLYKSSACASSFAAARSSCSAYTAEYY